MGHVVVPLAQRPLDVLLVLFFTLNVILILAIETQGFLFPVHLYPKALTDLVDWHVRTTGDFLVRDKPAYFRGLVMAEIFIQAPLSLLTSFAFVFGKKWGRMTGIIYGVLTATTMVPILADILASKLEKKDKLLAAYVPFLVIPLLVIVRLLPSSRPFGKISSKHKKAS